MFDSSIINGRTARTIFFIVFVGGLYFFSSFLLSKSCKLLFANVNPIFCINIFESAGVIAFFFIIFYGIKFGLSYSPDSKNYETQSSSQNKKYLTMNNDSVGEEYEQRIGEKTWVSVVRPNKEEGTPSYTVTNDGYTKPTSGKSGGNEKDSGISSKCMKSIEKMTDDQKKQLQLALAKSCGISIKKGEKLA